MDLSIIRLLIDYIPLLLAFLAPLVAVAVALVQKKQAGQRLKVAQTGVRVLRRIHILRAQRCLDARRMPDAVREVSLPASSAASRAEEILQGFRLSFRSTLIAY